MTGRRPLKVLLLTVDFPPADGGIQTLLSDLAVSIPDATVEVMAPAHPVATEWDRLYPCRVRRISPSPFGLAGYLAGLLAAALAAALRRRPDVIICGHIVLGPVAMALGGLFRCPIVTMVYAMEIRPRRVRRLAAALSARSSRIIAISSFTASEISKYGVDPGKVTVLRPGLRLRASPGTHAVAAYRRRLGLDDARVILTVSRLRERYKGHDTILRALPMVVARVPDAFYLIAGGGPLRGYLEDLARSLNLQERVRFLGKVPQDELPLLYAAADVFAMISRDSRIDHGVEGFGIVFLEANAAARPTLGGRAGGAVDAIVDERTGLLVDSLDVLAVADRLVRLLEDPALASRLGEQGQHWVRQEMGWEQLGARYSAVLQAVVQHPRASL
jgi:phosphatidylinositol alpha-1,6-mannosyltransferase